MRNIIAAFFLIILFACGSRKTDTQISKSSGTSDININSQMAIANKSEGIFTKNHTITDLGYGFSIEPINGQNSFFTLKSGTDSVQVQTNAKVSFNKNNKKEEIKIVYKYINVTTYYSQTAYKSHNTYKSFNKNKKTEKQAYPWWIFVILGMVLMITIILIWKWFKTTNAYTYLPFIQWKQK